jgi:hypothetical protein
MPSPDQRLVAFQMATPLPHPKKSLNVESEAVEASSAMVRSTFDLNMGVLEITDSAQS